MPTAPVTIRVPATSANLGPGFDTLGMALGLYNTFTFQQAAVDCLQPAPGSPQPLPVLSGEAAGRNLIFTTLDHLYQQTGNGQRPPCQVTVDTHVPLARGLGSSATAAVAALLAGNIWLGQPLDQTGLLSAAITIEGHPDNVVPAILGGLCWSDGHHHRQLAWPKDWGVCALVPSYRVVTERARQVLPEMYSRADVVAALRQASLLMLAVERHDPEALRVALATDCVHQPYRAALIPEFDRLKAALLADTSAYGLVISGSGPTLLMVYPQADQPILSEWLKGRSPELTAYWLPLDEQGAIPLLSV